jgi:stress response protein YsnF
VCGCAATRWKRRSANPSTSARRASTSSAVPWIGPTTGSEGIFQDRTIEVEERGEEAVVSKEARVREELVINKEVENRSETVSDTVRRTEVEIDDERTGTDTDRINRSR